MSNFEPHYAACRCGNAYYRDRVWKFLCLDCWKESKREAEERAAQPKESIKIVTVQAPPIELDMIRRLLQLCHPDRHGNSQAATEATKYLLGLKRQAGAG